MINISIDQSLSTNPDSVALASKKQIDISLSMPDISASLSGSSLMSQVKTNFTQQNIVLVGDTSISSSVGNMYYTPVYTEKINYEQWKSRRNTTFNELGIT